MNIKCHHYEVSGKNLHMWTYLGLIVKTASSPCSIAMIAFSTPAGKPKLSPSPISNFNSLSSNTLSSQVPITVTEEDRKCSG